MTGLVVAAAVMILAGLVLMVAARPRNQRKGEHDVKHKRFEAAALGRRWRRLLWLAGAAVLLLLGSACGGHHAATPASPAPSNGGPAVQALADLMAKAGCVGQPAADPQMFAKESVDCTVPGHQEVSVATFATSADRDQWVAAVHGYPVQTGDLWAVSGTDAASVTAFAAAVR